MFARKKWSRKNKGIALILALVISLMVPAASLASIEEMPEKPLFHKVIRGDSLWGIATRNNISPAYLALANGLDWDQELQEGEDIFIPSGDAVVYDVLSGDTLWSIAQKFNLTVDVLIDSNNIVEYDTLYPGQKLIIKTDLTQEVTLAPVFASFSDLSSFFIWPTQGWISSNYGMRDGKIHEGLDIAANLGSSIKALADGKVVFAGERGTYGKAVIINHGGGLRTLYAHASKLEVEAGQRVSTGDVIAEVGNTGRSTGPHLHLEVIKQGRPLNPILFLPK